MSERWKTLLTPAALVGLWWLLSDGETTSWLVGLPVVAAASWSVSRLGAPAAGRISPAGLLLFSVYFLWESVRGGVDVARRTLAPRLRIRPGFTVYRTELTRRDARVLFANCVSLLPGTLAADLRGDRLDVHLLDTGSDTTHQLRRLERAVTRLYPNAV